MSVLIRSIKNTNPKNITPSHKQQPFSLRLGMPEHYNILQDLSSQVTDKQMKALGKIGVSVQGKTATFKDHEVKPILDEAKITDKTRPISQNKYCIETKTDPIPIGWDQKTPLKIQFDNKPTHLSAGHVVIGGRVKLPLEAVGMPKPFGFMTGSIEGGISQGLGCQKNGFKRQIQLAAALAMGASDKNIQHIAKTHYPIDHLMHDRGMDGAADVGVLTGTHKDSWDYANHKTDADLKNRLAGTMRKTGKMPPLFFKKLLGMGQKPFESKGGKLSSERIMQELQIIKSDKLLNAFAKGGADQLRQEVIS